MKSKTTAILLCFLCGLHHIYLGEIKKFILYFLSCFVVIGFFWWLKDLITLITMSNEAFDAKYNNKTTIE